jgi:hypothetical protein
MARQGPTEEYRDEALRGLLSGLAMGDDIFELAVSLADLRPKCDTFSGDVFMEVAADALGNTGAIRSGLTPFERLRERYPPEFELRGCDSRRIRCDTLNSTSVGAGLESDLLDEVHRWGADEYWRYAIYASIVPPLPIRLSSSSTVPTSNGVR